MAKCYTIGTITDLQTNKVYKLDGVNVFESCLSDMVNKVRKNCTFSVIGGNGLIAIEDDDGVLRIEEVVTKVDEGRIPTITQTLIAYGIKDYTITER